MAEIAGFTPGVRVRVRGGGGGDSEGRQQGEYPKEGRIPPPPPLTATTYFYSPDKQPQHHFIYLIHCHRPQWWLPFRGFQFWCEIVLQFVDLILINPQLETPLAVIV